MYIHPMAPKLLTNTDKNISTKVFVVGLSRITKKMEMTQMFINSIMENKVWYIYNMEDYIAIKILPHAMASTNFYKW